MNIELNQLSQPKGRGWKLFAIAILSLIMAIPVTSIRSLIDERQERADDVIREVGDLWGGPQTLMGPMLVVPRESVTAARKNGEIETKTDRTLVALLPDILDGNTSLQPEVRERGIFQATVYTAKVTFNASFSPEQLKSLDQIPGRILWNEARIVVSVSDSRGIQGDLALTVNGEERALSAGQGYPPVGEGGFHHALSFDSTPETPLKVDLDLSLRGSRSFSVVPVGGKTDWSVMSSWPSPRFEGGFLPLARTVDKKGFDARWSVSELARGFSPVWEEWSSVEQTVRSSTFTVNLIRPVDLYLISDRATKYALLFISLTFLVFFVFEVITGKRVHPVQFLLVGSAMVLSYLSLLAFSEHVPFVTAYTLSALAVIVMVTAYARSVFAHTVWTSAIAASLTLLYGFLYTVLQLEDVALLNGTVALFVALAAIMFVTRNVTWYADESEPHNPSPESA